MTNIDSAVAEVKTTPTDDGEGEGAHSQGSSIVSFQSELPESLQSAMVGFIERHPNWDQYRLIQAALAGFLVQNGISTREITRLYVGNMFAREFNVQGV